MSSLAELIERPFAHRGLHDDRSPENSLSAFSQAVAKDLAIELDVRLSFDGVPVVFHDPTLLRMCGLQHHVSEIPATRLCRVPLRDSAQTVPTLAQALHAIGGAVPLLVDLKAGIGTRRRLVDAVAILLRVYPGPVGVVSFDPWMLNALRVRAPRLPRGQTAGPTLRPALRASDADFLNVNVDRLPSAAVGRIRRSVPVVAWTVRTAESYRIAVAGADGVMLEGDAVAYASRWGTAPARSVHRHALARDEVDHATRH